jgi:ERCC4-related helicase
VTVGLVGSDVLLASSETPRTDAEIIRTNLDEVADDCVRATFARKLERELKNVRELWQMASENAIARQNLLEKAREQQQQANQTAGKMRAALLDIASAVSPSRVFANADEQALSFIAKTATDALSGANPEVSHMAATPNHEK